MGKEIDKVKHMNLRSFLQEVYGLYEGGSFITDYDEIVEQPGAERAARNFLAPLGFAVGLDKSHQPSEEEGERANGVLYHAIARRRAGARVHLVKAEGVDEIRRSSQVGRPRRRARKAVHMTITELCSTKPTQKGMVMTLVVCMPSAGRGALVLMAQ